MYVCHSVKQLGESLTYSLIHGAYRPLHFSIQRSDGEKICSAIQEITDLIVGESRAKDFCFCVKH